MVGLHNYFSFIELYFVITMQRVQNVVKLPIKCFYSYLIKT